MRRKELNSKAVDLREGLGLTEQQVREVCEISATETRTKYFYRGSVIKKILY